MITKAPVFHETWCITPAVENTIRKTSHKPGVCCLDRFRRMCSCMSA